MTTERLTGLSLSLLQIHRDIPVDLEVAIDEFCRRHPRRMQMVEILEDRLIYNFLFTLSSLLRAEKVGVASVKWVWSKNSRALTRASNHSASTSTPLLHFLETPLYFPVV